MKNFILLTSLFVSLMNVSYAQQNFFVTCPGGVVQGAVTSNGFEEYVPLDGSSYSPNPPSCVSISDPEDPLLSGYLYFNAANCGILESSTQTLQWAWAGFYIPGATNVRSLIPVPIAETEDMQWYWELFRHDLVTDTYDHYTGAFQCLHGESGLKIKIGQTNLLDPLPEGVSGPVIAPRKEVVAFLEGAKTGDEVKVYIKGDELEPSLLSTKTLQVSDMDTDGKKGVVRFSIPLTIPELNGAYEVVGTHKIYVEIGDEKSNEYTIVVEAVPNLRVLLVKINSPYPLCFIDGPKGETTNCYTTASDFLYTNVITRQIPFTYGVFPYQSNSSDITFVPVEINGNLPSASVPYLSSFAKDYEAVISKMTEKNCQRAVLVVDHSYIDYEDHYPFLNPLHIQKAGVAIGRFAYVMEEYSQALAHELAHTFGVGHSSDKNFVALDGYSRLNLNGIDTRSGSVLVSRAAQDFMWGKLHDNDFPGNALDLYWTHRLVYDDLTFSIRRNIASAGSSLQDMISVTGFLSSNDLVSSSSAKIVSTEMNDPSFVESAYSISTVDVNGNILNTIGFSVDFEVESLISDTSATFIPTETRDSVPFTVFIPYSGSVKSVLVRKNGVVLLELPPSTGSDILTLQEGLNHIPDLGFIKDPVKSRQELAKFIQKIEDGKAKNNYHQVIAHLEVLRMKADQLLKHQYPVTSVQISKSKFDEIIVRELEQAREHI